MGFFDDIAKAAKSATNTVTSTVNKTVAKVSTSAQKTYKDAQKKTKAALKTIHSEGLYEVANVKKLVTNPKQWVSDVAGAHKRDAQFAGQFWGNFVGGKWGEIGKQAGSDFAQLQHDVGVKVAKDQDIKDFSTAAGKGYEEYNKGNVAGAAEEAAKGTPVVKQYSKEIGQAAAVGKAGYDAYNQNGVSMDSLKALASTKEGAAAKEFVLGEAAAVTGLGKDQIGAAAGLAVDTYQSGGANLGALKDAALAEGQKRLDGLVAKGKGIVAGQVSKLTSGAIAAIGSGERALASAAGTVRSSLGGAGFSLTVNALPSGGSKSSVGAAPAPKNKRVFVNAYFVAA